MYSDPLRVCLIFFLEYASKSLETYAQELNQEYKSRNLNPGTLA